MSFFNELRRRNVFRVGAVYAIVAWLLIQIATAIFPQLQLPAWTTTLVTVLLILGFPVALVLAWAFELTPDGVRLSQPAQGSQQTSGRRLDYALIGGLAVVAGLMLAAQLRTDRERAASAAGPARPSVAVLPFEDMSPAKDQQYFGDGIADEILNELTRLDGLDVASRTSSFVYQSSPENVPTIGRDLRVGAVLEGSVRKNGDTVRVTAQLINVADGYHLWSQTYDRTLADIFGIQEEIANAVAGALGVQFGLGGPNAFRGAGTGNVRAYDEYLRSFSITDWPERIRVLRGVVDMDPSYASAWAELGLATMSQMWTDVPSAAPRYIQSGLPFIERAAALDPANASAHSLLGTALYASNRWSEGEAEHQKAIALRASSDALSQHANLLMRAGRLGAALAQWDAADAADPISTLRNPAFRAYTLIGLGRFAEARAELPKVPKSLQSDVELLLALSTATSEDVKASIAALSEPRIAVTTLYQPLLRVFSDRDQVIALLHDVYANEVTWPGKWHDIARLAAYFGDSAFALEVAAVEARYAPPRGYALWMPFMAEARKLPAFKELVTDINLVDYWRRYGWPDLCRPLGETDFTCS